MNPKGKNNHSPAQTRIRHCTLGKLGYTQIRQNHKMKITGTFPEAKGCGLKIRKLDCREATAQVRRVKKNLKLQELQEKDQLFFNKKK